MGSFKRALFGYRRPDVEAAISTRDARIGLLERQVAECERQAEAIAEHGGGDSPRSRGW